VVRKLQGLILKNFKLNSTLNNIFTNKLFSSQKFDFYICSDDDFINGVAVLIQRFVVMLELVIFLLHMSGRDHEDSFSGYDASFVANDLSFVAMLYC
jgi:hypothetical protein